MIVTKQKRSIAVWMAVLLFFIAAAIVHNHPYFKNSVHALGLNLYYEDSVENSGFITRNYYEKRTVLSKEKHLIASSFGYEIMDDIADVDGDGVPELMCTCTWGGSGVPRLYVYKRDEDFIVRGEFTPVSIGADDIYYYGSGAFLTYYEPRYDRMWAMYTTIDASKSVILSTDQLQYSFFCKVL